MAKRLFLLLILGLFNIAMTPGFLMAADEVVLSDINPSKIYQTIEIVEEEPEEIYEEIAYADTIEEAPVYYEPVYVAPSNSIAVAGRVINIVDVDNTAVDAADHVNKYGDKFLYGHNSSRVFGGLYGVGVGSVFTVVYNGVSTNYQVQEAVTYEKASGTTLSVDGVVYNMRSIVKGLGRYDMVLMTCAGESYGNGDASHRLVIYANAI